MKCLLCISTILILILTILSCSRGSKLLCYYDISSASKVGPAKFSTKDMEWALQFCTHVIYSYVTITPKKFIITAVTPEREHELEKVKVFKKKFPKTKFLLSLGGDNNRKTIKTFLSLLETDYHQKEIFIKSLMKILIKYNFDGLSLDLQLPRELPQTQNNFINKIGFFFKKLYNERDDSKARAYRDQLTSLIQKLSANLKQRQGLLSLNILPNVDCKKYFDASEIIKSLDFIVLSAFDFYTPQISPNLADLMSPKAPDGLSKHRRPLTNMKSLYKYWHSQNVPRGKIIIGIAAFGRAWKMTLNSNRDGIPPVVNTDGPAAGGPQTQTPGFLSWPEICQKLNRDNMMMTRSLGVKSKTDGYAFRLPDKEGKFGIWISYEDPMTAAVKAKYVRNHNLGGVALFDLSLDDVHGNCSGEKFPILKSIKFRLTQI